MSRVAFLRPIEITASNNSFTTNVGGAGAVGSTIATGTYGSILTVLYAFEAAIEADLVAVNPAYTCTITLTTDFFVNIAISIPAPETVELVFTDTPLADLTGFGTDTTLNWAGSGSETGTLTPSHCWLSTFERSNQSFFALQQSKVVKGINAASGAFAGTATGTDRRECRFDFEYEPAVNISEEFALTAYDTARNFETFIYEARAATQSSSTNQSSRGFYVYPEYTDAQPVAAMTTNEGIQYAYTSSPDTHTFCHLLAQGAGGEPTAALPAGRERFNVTVRAITATAPTWDA